MAGQFEGPGWFYNVMKRLFGTLFTTGGINKAAHVADAAALTLTAVTDLTDNTGQSGTHDDTLAAQTSPAVLTAVANVDGATPNDEIQDSSANLTQAEFRVFAKTIKEKLNAVIALQAVQSQNISDVCQKVKEVKAKLDAGIVDLGALRTTLNGLIASLETAGIKATS